MKLHEKTKEHKLIEYRKVKTLYEGGLSFSEIGKMFGHTREWASQVVRGKMKCQQNSYPHTNT